MEKFATQLNALNGLAGHVGNARSIARSRKAVLHIAAEAGLQGKDWHPFIDAWNALHPEDIIASEDVWEEAWIPPLL